MKTGGRRSQHSAEAYSLVYSFMFLWDIITLNAACQVASYFQLLQSYIHAHCEQLGVFRLIYMRFRDETSDSLHKSNVWFEVPGRRAGMVV